MLTESDKAWIQSNRTELTDGRTVAVTLAIVTEGTKDTYTDEPTTSEDTMLAECIWREYQTVARTQRSIVDGISVQEGDVEAKFDGAYDIPSVKYVKRGDDTYAIVSLNHTGIGEEYRYVALLRKVT
jgi:hypothetical protein